MEIILLEKIRNLGSIGDKVNVKAGYARNYLLPQKMAVTATPKNIAKFEEMHVELEKKAADLLAVAKSRAEALGKLAISIPMKANEEGKLFGSVSIHEIVNAIKEHGIEVDKKEIVLPQGPIHQLGEFEINLQLHTDVNVVLRINIIAKK
jgi:large subunit ribosomal protein L9